MIYGFDFDGTLVKSFTSEPLPNVRNLLFAGLPVSALTFIATNQAGPVYRAMYGSSKYPTVAHVVENIASALSLWALDCRPALLLLCCNSGQIGADWVRFESQVAATFNRQLATLGIEYEVAYTPAHRKPQPGMLNAAAQYFGVQPADLVYVGDMESDAVAARQAGARFVQAEDWHAGRVAL